MHIEKRNYSETIFDTPYTARYLEFYDLAHTNLKSVTYLIADNNVEDFVAREMGDRPYYYKWDRYGNLDRLAYNRNDCHKPDDIKYIGDERYEYYHIGSETIVIEYKNGELIYGYILPIADFW